MNFSSRPRRGFTLVELLVVVVIIALLISILVPTLGQAKEQARQAICLSNQANITKALMVYHGTWNWFPYNYADYLTDGWWYNGVKNWGMPLVDYGGWEAGWDNTLTSRTRERQALGVLSELCGGRKGRPNTPGGPVVAGNFWNADENEFSAMFKCPSANLNTLYLNQPTDKYIACYWTNPAVRLNCGWAGYHGGAMFRLQDSSNNYYPIGNDNYAKGRGWVAGLCTTPGCSGKRAIYNPRLDDLPIPSETVFSGDTNEQDTNQANFALLPGDGHMIASPGYWGVALEYSRHQGKIIVSYVDGHAARIDKTAAEAPGTAAGNPSGTFMIKYPQSWNCTPANLGYHYLPKGPVN
jgi:prepilin-type N-terminal cleavage/methylation domain-containing protein/prepilin-type processing-associated H-X9-DG protein